jgi:DNA-binding transcriptional regulator YhcF (GntR family)
MDMDWKFRNGIPIYLQIIDEMTMRIASGAYKPGEKLPSVRDLSMEAGVNPNTMQKAMAELERKKLVFSERTSGRFVTEDESVLKELHEELAKKYFAELSEKLTKIGMTGEEIAEAIRSWLEELR